MSSINEALRRSNRAESTSGAYVSLTSLPEKKRPRFAFRWIWLLIPLVVLAALGGYWLRENRVSGMDAPKPAAPSPVRQTTEVKPPVATTAPPAAPTTPREVEKPAPAAAPVAEPPAKVPASGLGEGLIAMPGQAKEALGSALPSGKKPLIKSEALVDAAKTLPPGQDSAVDHLGAGPASSLGKKQKGDQTAGDKTVTPKDPTNSDILMAADYFQIASTSAEQGRYSEAAEAYKRAIALHPRMVEAYLNLGNIYLYHFEEHQKAQAEYEAALKLDPVNKMAQNNLGVMLLRQNRLKEAEGRFNAALKSDPEYVDPLYNLACVAARSGRAEKALSYLDQARKLEPEVADWAADDEDLKSLRGHPEFAIIVQAK